MYKFTFKTDRALFEAQHYTGFIDSYDIVRMEVKSGNDIVDFPCKSEEEYDRCLKVHGDNIKRVYQDTHSFDINDYN